MPMPSCHPGERSVKVILRTRCQRTIAHHDQGITLFINPSCTWQPQKGLRAEENRNNDDWLEVTRTVVHVSGWSAGAVNVTDDISGARRCQQEASARAGTIYQKKLVEFA